jgi:hypothetical protein
MPGMPRHFFLTNEQKEAMDVDKKGYLKKLSDIDYWWHGGIGSVISASHPSVMI